MLEKFVKQKEELTNKVNKILNKNIEILRGKFEELKQRIQKETITIGVMATVSNGKSTFLNALVFENQVLDAKSGETTATLFEIKYGKKYKINEKELNSLEELKKEIQNINRELLKKLKEGSEFKTIIVEIPNEKLKNIVLLDTPGYGSINENIMKKILIEASKKSDAIVLILDISQGLKQEDKKFLEEIKENNLIDKTFIVLNKIDAVINEDDKELKSEEELKKEIEDVINKTKEEVNKIISTNHIYALSAKKALVGKLKNNKEKLKESKFESFERIFWEESIKLKQNKFKYEINYFNRLKNEFCKELKSLIKNRIDRYGNLKDLLNACPDIKIEMEIETLKNKQELLSQALNFQLDKEKDKKFKEKVFDTLRSDLRYRLDDVGFFESFSEDNWNYAIKRGLEDFEKDFSKIFVEDYFKPILFLIQDNVYRANDIIKEINIIIDELSRLTSNDLKKFDLIELDFKINSKGEIEYSSKEFVNLLEDLGFSAAAGAAGFGVGMALELIAGRLITFSIPVIGWILGIAAAGYTLYKQSQKSEEILRMVINEIKPQILELINDKQNQIKDNLIDVSKDAVQRKIGEIQNTINEMIKVLKATKEEKIKIQEQLSNINKEIENFEKIFKEICE